MDVQATPAQLREARGWILDCGWQDLTPAQVRRMPAADVVRGVERNYEGGWAQFVRDGGE